MDLATASFDPTEAVLVLPVTSAEWIGAQQQLQGYDAATGALLLGIVELIRGEARGLLLCDEGGTPVASAVISVIDGLVFVGNVITAGHRRRRGLARMLLSTGLDWARRSGGRQLAIKVLADNAPAIALYEGLGCVRRYEYHYRRPRS
jgi:ribosomal protein S18 acetylase RimI-like enzyme